MAAGRRRQIRYRKSKRNGLSLLPIAVPVASGFAAAVVVARLGLFGAEALATRLAGAHVSAALVFLIGLGRSVARSRVVTGAIVLIRHVVLRHDESQVTCRYNRTIPLYVSGLRSRKNCQVFLTSRILSKSSSAVTSASLSRSA